MGLPVPKNGCGPAYAHMGLGSQNLTKKLVYVVDLLGPLLSQNHVFEISEDQPPSPLNTYNNPMFFSIKKRFVQFSHLSGVKKVPKIVIAGIHLDI